jgi:hypothetical protein
MALTQGPGSWLFGYYTGLPGGFPTGTLGVTRQTVTRRGLSIHGHRRLGKRSGLMQQGLWARTIYIDQGVPPDWDGITPVYTSRDDIAAIASSLFTSHAVPWGKRVSSVLAWSTGAGTTTDWSSANLFPIGAEYGSGFSSQFVFAPGPPQLFGQRFKLIQYALEHGDFIEVHSRWSVDAGDSSPPGEGGSGVFADRNKFKLGSTGSLARALDPAAYYRVADIPTLPPASVGSLTGEVVSVFTGITWAQFQAAYPGLPYG